MRWLLTPFSSAIVGTLLANALVTGCSGTAHDDDGAVGVDDSEVTTDTVRYRVNAGGAATSETPAWAADTTAAPSPYSNYAATGDKTASTTHAIDMSHPSIPRGTPSTLFQSERYSTSTAVGSTSMKWHFPTTAGQTYAVRLYFAEIFAGCQQVGCRKFDVAIEGKLVLNGYDTYADVGGYKGVVKSFDTVADSELDVDLIPTGVQSPRVMAIEIVQKASTTSADAGTVDAATTPSRVLFGQADRTGSPPNFSRTQLQSMETTIGRHDYVSQTLYNFFGESSRMGADEAWMTSRSPRTYPIANIGGRMEAATSDFPGPGDTGLVGIAAGKYDATMKSWAVALKGVVADVWVRPWREMNGDWTPWYTTNQAHYVAAWRRLWTIFRGTASDWSAAGISGTPIGATNVHFIWCPAFTGSQDHTGMAWYPGDRYVDWAGIDGYANSRNWRTFAELFTPFHTAFYGRKPIIVVETAPENDSRAPAWLSAIPSALAALPGIEVVSFWDEGDHPLVQSTGATAATEAAYLKTIADVRLGATASPF